MIELKDIVVKFGDFEALHNINVNVKEGEFFTFLGPSGCGKTTTLRTITGFIEPVSGTVSVNNQDITHVPKSAAHPSNTARSAPCAGTCAQAAPPSPARVSARAQAPVHSR